MESLLSNVSQFGWGTAITVIVILVILIWRERKERRAKAEQELKDAEANYKDAVRSADPDRIKLAADRLRRAKKDS